MLNKVMLIGRLGRDPELRYTQNGTPVTSLNVATDESYTDRDGNRQERTEWHRVAVFQKQAELCSNYLSKGSLVYVEGFLQTRKWQDQQGMDRYTTEIRAQRVQFLDRKGNVDGMQRGGDDYQQGRGGWNGNHGQSYQQQAPQSYAQEGYQQTGYGSSQTSQQNRFRDDAQMNQDMEANRDKDLGSPTPSESSLDEVPF